MFITKQAKTLITIEETKVALACDFLKELDSSFDFPKPDVHIREILLELGFLDKDMSISRDYMCIAKMCEIAKKWGFLHIV